MFVDHLEVCPPSPEIEIRIPPGVKVTASAQAEPRLGAFCPGLPGVVDDEDRYVLLALELPEVSKDAGDLEGSVLVDPVKTHEGIKDEEPWPVAGHRLGE